ncbi:hypothetical protein GGI42DRAFT_176247 [Trichoderma sp. SZMC 28013]
MAKGSSRRTNGATCPSTPSNKSPEQQAVRASRPTREMASTFTLLERMPEPGAFGRTRTCTCIRRCQTSEAARNVLGITSKQGNGRINHESTRVLNHFQCPAFPFLSRFPLSCPNPATNGRPRSAVIGPSMSGPANRAMHLRSWALKHPIEPPLRLARGVAVTRGWSNQHARSPSQAQAPAPCRSFPTSQRVPMKPSGYQWSLEGPRSQSQEAPVPSHRPFKRPPPPNGSDGQCSIQIKAVL